MPITLVDNNKIKLVFSYSPEMVEWVKKFNNRKYDPKDHSWMVSVDTNKCVEIADTLFKEAVEKKWLKEMPDFLPKIKEFLNRNIAESKQENADIEIPCNDGLAYMPFQKAGISYIENHKGITLLGDQMGLGKSVMSVGYINLHDEYKKILIIVPASLKLNWRNEIEKWQTKQRSIQILDSKTQIFHGDIQIVNYDILLKLFINVGTEVIDGQEIKDTDKLTLKRPMDYDLIVCDEAHYIKNHKSLRSKALKLIAKPIHYKLFLTGTPILNRPVEAFNMLNLLRPDVFGSWWHYTHKYCNYKDDGYGIDVKGSSNLDELNDKLRSTCMIRRLKEDVLKELPEKRRSVIPVEGDRKIINKSQEILDKIRGEVETSDKASVILGEIEKLRQDAVALKLEGAAQEFIKSMVEQEKKIVVFLHHKFAVEILEQWLVKEKIGYAKIVGDVDAADRQAEVNRFQNDKTCMVFVGSIHAAGVGITLTAASDTLFLELDWVPANLLQAEDRNHRIGTKNTVNIYYMVVDQTIEMDMMKLLEKKFKIVSQAVDGVTLDDSTKISLFEF